MIKTLNYILCGLFVYFAINLASGGAVGRFEAFIGFGITAIYFWNEAQGAKK